jgi:hypothetical protein
MVIERDLILLAVQQFTSKKTATIEIHVETRQSTKRAIFTINFQEQMAK